jgi:hypothetical protein
MKVPILNRSTVQPISAILSAGLCLAAAGDELSTLCGVLIGSLDLALPIKSVHAAHVAPPPARVSAARTRHGTGVWLKAGQSLKRKEMQRVTKVDHVLVPFPPSFSPVCGDP